MTPGVGAETRIYAVIGHPAGHSLSPRMQNAAFQAAGLDAVYLALDVPPDRFEAALEGLHASGIAGLNVTTPHKEAARGVARTVTEEAERVGVVNTLRRTDEGWHGDATDGPGFSAWLRRLGLDVRGARVLLLGAGGAARSVVPALLGERPAALGVVSRDGARAAALAERWRASGEASVLAASLDVPARGLDGPWDLLVRALATEALANGEAAWWDRLAPTGIALDLNYGDRAAAARRQADLRGHRFEDGLGLLVHQGALSFEFWMGRPAPFETMWEALRR